MNLPLHVGLAHCFRAFPCEAKILTFAANRSFLSMSFFLGIAPTKNAASISLNAGSSLTNACASTTNG